MADDPSAILPSAWSSDDAVAWPFTRLLWRLAAIAYDAEPAGLDELRSLGLTGTLVTGRGVDAFPMAVYAVATGSESIVAFRGTQGAGSILQDLKVVRRRTSEGSLHAGFADGYGDVHDRLVSRLRRTNAKRVWLTGHSLGGALAVVGADRLEEAGFEVAGVMTFGQPMVAMPDFARVLARRFRGRYVAFENGTDPVPRAVLPYVHFGRCIRLQDGVFIRFDRVPRTFGVAPPVGDGAGARPADDGGPEPMDAAELDAVIDRLEAGESGPWLAPRGPVVARGRFDLFQGHTLAAYAGLVERFLGAPPSPP